MFLLYGAIFKLQLTWKKKIKDEGFGNHSVLWLLLVIIKNLVGCECVRTKQMRLLYLVLLLSYFCVWVVIFNVFFVNNWHVLCDISRAFPRFVLNFEREGREFIVPNYILSTNSRRAVNISMKLFSVISVHKIHFS